MPMSTYQRVLEKTNKRIAPSWPLKNFVAVNPYAGFTDTDYRETAQIMSSRAGVKMTMPLSFYLDQLEKGAIHRDDVKKAINKSGKQDFSVDSFIGKAKAFQEKVSSENQGYNFLDIATRLDQTNWKELMVDRVSFWAASHFDKFVGIWGNKDSEKGLYRAWIQEAQIDRSPEIMGLSGFRSSIKQLPQNPLDFIDNFLSQLKLDEEENEAYLHALLLKVLGWSSYIAGLDFHNTLYDGNKSNLTEFLAVLLTWENYFLHHSKNKEKIKALWYQQWHSGEPLHAENEVLKLSLIFQDALDFASQKELKSSFKEHGAFESEDQVDAQMVFCIDVRSEVFRRNLEMVIPRIETVGFAGFFGFPVKYVPLGHDEGKNQCPVLIPSSALVKESCPDKSHATKKRVSDHQIGKTWKKFKSGAVTSFGFVSPIGLSFLPKILLNSFHLTRPLKDPKKDGIGKWLKEGKMLDLSSIDIADKVSMAASALTGMGLKDKLARFVLITGHGSSSVNNPHASGLDCGACGGHSGEVNALTAQYIFNDPEVRNRLKEEGIHIPKETIFLACLHDTTTDDIHFINDAWVPESRQKELDQLKESIVLASKHTRLERKLRLQVDGKSDVEIEKQLKARAQDWAQVRPEWGLAGCHSFIIAPRNRSKGVKLNGKSFLHNYQWQEDSEFKILESIMTAPMVVTSWINLQYYASTTDNQHLGAGNKTLHNITSGLGVLEGSSGDLRIGLPIQSVHNGEKFEHIPIRLNVVIEAPTAAINKILEKHDHIRQLFDHEWIFLHRMNEFGKITQTYQKNLEWSNEAKVEIPIEESVL